MTFALVFLLCLILGVPIFATLGVPSLIELLTSPIPLESLAHNLFDGVDKFPLLAIPNFVLAGAIMSRAGITRDIISVMRTVVGGAYGGLAIVTILSCMFFAAISGSGPGTVAAIGTLLIPAMKEDGYPTDFAASVASSGGTLGILIPPSVVLVIYAIITEQNIAKLFLAAFIPGILAALGYIAAISIYVRINPGSAGTRERMPYGERFRALLDVWPVLLVFGLVVGGIYTGIFTPTEGAAVGAFGTGLIAWLGGGLTMAALSESFIVTARSTAMIFFIVLGAAFYNGFLALSGVPQFMADWVVTQGFSPLLVMATILVFYMIFGCLMDSLSMILLTVPIFFPVISAMDFGMSPEHLAIWFGILVLIVVEVGLITPPVGMNLFIINSMDRETPMTDTYKAVMWFVGSDIVRVIILVLFPAITLFLLPG